MPKRKTILYEAKPSGPVTQAADPIPVLFTLRYQIGLGDIDDVAGVAVAWTRTEVLVRFGGLPVEVWLPAGDVRRV